MPRERTLHREAQKPALALGMSKARTGQNFFQLHLNKKTVFFFGGSLGAKSINEAVDERIYDILKEGLQLICQTGKPYLPEARERAAGKPGVWVNDFITRMEYAYAASDIRISRAGSVAIAELCVMKKPTLFVPFPYAAEDHQTVNAMSLVNKHAALIVKDSEAKEKLVPMIIELAKDDAKQSELKRHISELAIKNADEQIAGEILKLL